MPSLPLPPPARPQSSGSPRSTATTLAALLDEVRHSASARRHGVGFVDAREEPGFVSWRDLVCDAAAVALRLRPLVASAAAGGRGDDTLPQRVAVVCPTGADFFRALFGCWLAGLAPAPLPPPQRFAPRDAYVERPSRALDACGAALVLCPARHEALLVAAARRSGESASRVLRLDQLSVPALQGAPSPVADAAGEGAGSAPLSESVALIQFSSGTTGEAKPIALSHRALLAQAELLSSCWPDGAQARQSGVSWLPLYHDMGLIGCVLPALLRCADLTLLRPETFVARPATWLRTVSDRRATVSPAPDFAYRHCVRKVRDAELEGVDLSCWRTALDGSETIAPTTLRAFSERFSRWGLRPAALTPAYGLAEAALAVTLSDLDAPARTVHFDRAALERGVVRSLPAAQTAETTQRQSGSADSVELVSLGRPLAGFELRIVAAADSSGRMPPTDAPTDEVGRVWIRGPSLLSGILRRRGDSWSLDPATRDGWLDTGDRGLLWSGELFLLGRDRDLVIVRGRSWPAQWLEQMLAGEEALEEAAVAASSATWRPGGEGAGDDGEGYVLLAETRVAEEQRAGLVRRLRGLLLAGAGAAPRAVVLVRPGSLPRTSSGKLRRTEAASRWREGRLPILYEAVRETPGRAPHPAPDQGSGGGHDG